MDKTSKALLFGIAFFAFILTGILLKNFILILIGISSLVAMFIFAIGGNTDTKNNANDKFSNALKQHNFFPNKKVLSFNLTKGLAINEEFKQVAIATRYTENDEFTLKLIPFKDIVEAKVLTNHETVTSASIGSAVVRGTIGSLIFGMGGGIVAGVTANKTSSQKIKELTLEIVIDDVLNPRHTITFYEKDLPLNETSPLIQEIEEWYRSFSVIINRNSNNARSV